MKTIASYEAKSKFSEILREVSEGESYVITRHGQRVAELHPPAPAPKRKRGAMKDVFGPVSDDFDEPLEDFKDYE